MDEINIDKNAAIIQRFKSREGAYRIFNVFLLLWIIVQIALYSWEISLSPCSESKCCLDLVTNLGIGYLINYVLYIFVPLMVLCVLQGWRILMMSIGYCGLNIVIKIIVMVILLTSAWRHVGMCYINSSVKGTIVSTCVIEMLILVIQIWLLNRKKEILSLENSLAEYMSRSGAKVL